MNDHPLSAQITEGATLRGNQYGWSIASFPEALARAESEGYACLGGQFQFRLRNGNTCEMYWLKADSDDRTAGEPWAAYSHRSCSEVLSKFRHLVSETDFTKEASDWPDIISKPKDLVFVAYFVSDGEWAELTRKPT